LLILSLAVTFGSLEAYARFKYYGWNLRPVENGFPSRGKSYEPRKHTRYRIICVGESTTYGYYNEAEKSYPFYLEKILSERRGKDFAEVINSGKMGSRTTSHRDMIRDRISQQDVDIIVLHSFYNYFSIYHTFDPKVNKFIVNPYTERLAFHWDRLNPESINVFLMEHSYFYTRLREKILLMQGRNLDSYYAGSYPFASMEGAKVNVDTEEKRARALSFFLDLYSRKIEEMVLIARAHDVDIVLIIPPYPMFKEEEEMGIAGIRATQYYATVFEEARKCILDLGQKYGLLVIDADKEFMRSGRSKDLFLDNIHLTPKGENALADMIADGIISRAGK